MRLAANAELWWLAEARSLGAHRGRMTRHVPRVALCPSGGERRASRHVCGLLALHQQNALRASPPLPHKRFWEAYFYKYLILKNKTNQEIIERIRISDVLSFDS